MLTTLRNMGKGSAPDVTPDVPLEKAQAGWRHKRKRGPGTRVYYAADAPPTLLAVWASRIALFSAVTLLITAVLHRLLSLPTPVAMTIAWGVFIAAAAALTMAAIAGLDIWVTGRQGAARVVLASVVSLVLLAIPASVAALSLNWPAITDVTTDLTEPPEYTEAKSVRAATGGIGVNAVAYAGARFANQQIAHYPDLKSLVVPRPPEQAYELVLQALAKQRQHTTFESPPDPETGSAGFVEYSERTLVLGLTDDVVIRVLPEGDGARIDVRSSSRYGSNDFGGNAERVRLLLKEIVGRLEASIPEPRSTRPDATDDKSKAKRKRERGPASAADRRRPDPSRSSARREPARRASPQE